MNKDEHARRLTGAMGWGVFARVVRMVLSVIAASLAARKLGEFNYGIWVGLQMTFAFMGGVVGAGLAQGLLRYIPAWWMGGKIRNFPRILLAVTGIQGLLWLGVVAAVYALEPWLAAAGVHPDTIPLMQLGTIVLIAEVLAQTLIQVSNAFYDTRTVGFATLISSFVYVVLLWELLSREPSVRSVIVAAAVSHAVLASALVLRFRYYKHLPPPSHKPDADAPTIRQLMAYSAPFAVIAVLNLITYRQSEVLLLLHFVGAPAAGFFGLAYKIPQMILQFIPGAIWPLIMTGSAAAYLRDPGALQRAVSAYYRLLFLLAAPLSLGGVLTGDMVVRIIGGSAFAPAESISRVLFFFFGMSFLSAPLSMVFYIVEKPQMGLRIIAVTAFLNVSLDFLLIPRFGLWGAVPPVALIIVLSPWINRWLLNRMGFNIQIPWKFLARVYAASCLIFLLIPLKRFLGVTISSFVLLVFLGGILNLIGLRLFHVLGESEQKLIRRASPRLWSLVSPVLIPHKDVS